MRFLLPFLFFAHFAFGSAAIQDASVTQKKLNDQVSEPDWFLNCTVTSSVASNALTISIKDKAGSDPTSLSPCKVSFRNATTVTGTYTQVSITSALSVVVPSGTTLGTAANSAEYLYVYLLNNAGTAEVAVSIFVFGQGSIRSTTAISGGASRTTLYSTTARSNVPIRLIGRVKISEVTPGTWATAATEHSNWPFDLPRPFAWSGTHLNDCAWSSTSTTYADFTADATCTFTETFTGGGFPAVTSYLSAGNKLPGLSFTPNTTGLYEICATANAHGQATGGSYSFRLIDTASVVLVEHGVGGSGQGDGTAFCGYKVLYEGNLFEIRFQAISGSGDGAHFISLPTTNPANIIVWTVKRL